MYRWQAEGVSNREIARRPSIDEQAVLKLVRRLGWRERSAPQQVLPFADADPKPSASEMKRELPPFSLDRDPADRSGDRLLAGLGLLEDAAPPWGASTQVPGLGILPAIPARVHRGVFSVAREIDGGLGPAFHGLRTTLGTLLRMALLRSQRPEELKERSPRQLGQGLGLDPAPEVKTLRRKLARLAAHGRALALRRVASRGHAVGLLHGGGHVSADHGGREIQKTRLARMRISMPATTDDLVHDAESEPLFVVPTEANRGLVQILPSVLTEVRKLAGEPGHHRFRPRRLSLRQVSRLGD